MDSLQGIRRLLPVLDMACQAEQLKMARIIKRIDNLRSQLAGLNRQVIGPRDTLTAATMAGADLLWQNWAQDRKTLINQELALASRDREAARSAMVKALSKFEAAKQVETRAEFAARQIIERRSSW